MSLEDIDAWLAQSLADRQFSRTERQTLLASAEAAGSAEARATSVGRAFAVARAAVMAADADPEGTLRWLESVVVALRERPVTGEGRPRAAAFFSPGDDCPRAILGLLGSARQTVDACVFTITDDRLADGLIAAKQRGVTVRVVTDDAKADDLGSDADRLARAGVAVRVDRSPFHMHHKFVIVDGSVLLTGSYNWTRGAANDNEENLIITEDLRLIEPFFATFEELWGRFA